MGTLFTSVYDRFFSKITDDMYMELTPQDTLKDVRNLLINSIPGFEFPRKTLNYMINISKENEDLSEFSEELTSEEIDILAILMMNGWLQRQITSIENTRMKYSGTDFKMTSQANHLGKLLNLLSETQRQSKYMQRLYKRRRTDENGFIKSNWGVFLQDSALTGNKVVAPEPSTSTIVFDGGFLNDNSNS